MEKIKQILEIAGLLSILFVFLAIGLLIAFP